jgi:hypothetical protein
VSVCMRDVAASGALFHASYSLSVIKRIIGANRRLHSLVQCVTGCVYLGVGGGCHQCVAWSSRHQLMTTHVCNPI